MNNTWIGTWHQPVWWGHPPHIPHDPPLSLQYAQPEMLSGTPWRQQPYLGNDLYRQHLHPHDQGEWPDPKQVQRDTDIKSTECMKVFRLPQTIPCNSIGEPACLGKSLYYVDKSCMSICTCTCACIQCTHMYTVPHNYGTVLLLKIQYGNNNIAWASPNF